MFDEKFSIYDGDRIVLVLSGLVEKARVKGVSVIYLRNDGGEGEPDEVGTPGWEIHPLIRPMPNEVIVDKQGPDAFENTNLQIYLEERGIERLVIAGMQTEMCVKTSAHRAIELGYEVVLVEDGHSTFDFDDLKAVDEIRRVNAEFRKLAQVVFAKNIKF